MCVYKYVSPCVEFSLSPYIQMYIHTPIHLYVHTYVRATLYMCTCIKYRNQICDGANHTTSRPSFMPGARTVFPQLARFLPNTHRHKRYTTPILNVMHVYPAKILVPKFGQPAKPFTLATIQ